MKVIKEINSLTTVDNLCKNRKKRAQVLIEEVNKYFEKDRSLDNILSDIKDRVDKMHISESKDVVLSIEKYLERVLIWINELRRINNSDVDNKLRDKNRRYYDYLKERLSFVNESHLVSKDENVELKG